MEQCATLIGPVDNKIRQRSILFAKHVCHVPELDLISNPMIAEVLAGQRFVHMPARAIHAQREIVRTRAAVSVYQRGARECVLLTRLSADLESDDIDNCVELLRCEHEIVSDWGLFRKIHLACVLPDLTLQEVDI